MNLIEAIARALSRRIDGFGDTEAVEQQRVDCEWGRYREHAKIASEVIQPEIERLTAQVERMREALDMAFDALRNHACHGGLDVPCIRSADQCTHECGKAAGDALILVEAALRPRSEREGWQPIETAPPGQCVVVFDGRKITIAEWADDLGNGPGWFSAEACGPFEENMISQPTHWRPLPAPPERGDFKEPE